MVKTLLLVNIIVFLVDAAFSGATRGAALAPHAWGAFSVDQGIFGFQIWRVVTYQFLHASFGHILFNMIGIYFLGNLLEPQLGSRKFLAFYLLCGIGGALVMTLLVLVAPGFLGAGTSTPVVGASGAFYGIVAGLMTTMPNMKLRLFLLPFEFTVKQFGAFILILAGITLLTGGHNTGGEAVHLGGALIGWLLARNLKCLDWAERGVSVVKPTRGGFGKRRRFKVVSGGKMGKKRAKSDDATPTRDDVDAVLDKIAKSGIGSLNTRERSILERARKDL